MDMFLPSLILTPIIFYLSVYIYLTYMTPVEQPVERPRTERR